jgi:hypothetical protein
MISKGCLVKCWRGAGTGDRVFLVVSDPYEGGHAARVLRPDDSTQVVDILYKGKVIDMYTGLLEIVSQ